MGTGAYMFAAYDPNKQLKVVRNPYFKEWSKDAQPDGYPDEVHYDFGLTQEAQITAIENGQADWTLDQPPPDRLAEIGSKYKSQVHINTLTAMWYAPMNVNIPPFNNLKARQAVNFAIDRNAMVKLFGGKVLAQPACQVLPPGFPGYEPYCPYTKNPGTKWSAPDLAKAKELVKESGTAGQKVTIIVQDLTVDRSIGTYLQSVLKSIGYDASVKALSQNIQFTYIQNTNNKVQISVSQWYQDYPAPSDFLNVLLGCGTFHPGSDNSPNIAGFCDKDHPGQDECSPGLGRDRSGRRQQGMGGDRQADGRPGAGGGAVHAEIHRLPVEAREELRLQCPVLLAAHGIVDQVEPGAAGLPGRLFIGGFRQDDGQPADHD